MIDDVKSIIRRHFGRQSSTIMRRKSHIMATFPQLDIEGFEKRPIRQHSGEKVEKNAVTPNLCPLPP